MKGETRIQYTLEGQSAISDLKRMFGEYVHSKRFGNMVKEIARNIAHSIG